MFKQSFKFGQESLFYRGVYYFPNDIEVNVLTKEMIATRNEISIESNVNRKLALQNTLKLLIESRSKVKRMAFQ